MKANILGVKREIVLEWKMPLCVYRCIMGQKAPHALRVNWENIPEYGYMFRNVWINGGEVDEICNCRG